MTVVCVFSAQRSRSTAHGSQSQSCESRVLVGPSLFFVLGAHNALFDVRKDHKIVNVPVCCYVSFNEKDS